MVRISEPHSTQHTEKSRLIRDSIVNFSLNCNEPLNDLSMQGYLQLWEESFADLSYAILAAAFAKTIRTCKFFPKVADVRGEIDGAIETATEQAAEIEWGKVLDLRRMYWNPDMPGGFSRGMPQLSERVQQAARASGVFRDFESTEGLHVWAKKRFIESYITWGELEQDRFFLSDGELKNLLTDAAQAKTLPLARNSFADLYERGLQYAKKIKEPESAAELRQKAALKVTPILVIATPERVAELKEQKRQILAKYSSLAPDEVAV